MIANLAALILGATPLWAECTVPDPTLAAAGWTVQDADGEWIATHPDFSNVEAALFMHTSARPRILDWAIPERYKGRIGVLQHYAGAPGTFSLVTLVTNVVIDLETGAALGKATASVDCVATVWHWYDTAIVVEDVNYGEVVIKLP
jgi:hypothetical protein